jgi:hypothetical protein
MSEELRLLKSAKREAPRAFLVLLAGLLCTPAFKIGFVLFICIFFGPRAYFDDGLRLLSYSPLVLSDGRELPRAYGLPVFLLVGASWLMLVFPTWRLVRALYGMIRPFPSPIKGEGGTIYFYSAIKVFAAAGATRRVKMRGLVEASSKEEAIGILKNADLWCPYVREARKREVASGKYAVTRAGEAREVKGEDADVWVDGTPSDYILPEPGGRCWILQDNQRLRGHLNLAKRGRQNYVRFEYERPGNSAQKVLEIPFNQISAVQFRTWPKRRLWVIRGDGSRLLFGGNVRKCGMLFRYVLVQERKRD